MEYKIVEDNPDLVRDPHSGAIINTNRAAYEQAVTIANQKKAEADKLNSAVEDINNLKEEIGEIKSLLKELIQRV